MLRLRQGGGLPTSQCCSSFISITGKPFGPVPVPALTLHISPSLRFQFPVDMKSHLSHDVVLLCQSCQATCNIADHQRMAMLGLEHGAPLEGDTQRFKEDYEAVRTKRAASALRQHHSGKVTTNYSSCRLSG